MDIIPRKGTHSRCRKWKSASYTTFPQCLRLRNPPISFCLSSKQIFCRLRNPPAYLSYTEPFYSLFALYIECFLSVKSILRSYTCLFAKSDFLPIGSDYFSFTSMIQIFYYFLCPISDTVHFLNPFPLIFMLLFICTKLYQMKRNKKDMIS